MYPLDLEVLCRKIAAVRWDNYETLHCPTCGRVRYCPHCNLTVAECADICDLAVKLGITWEEAKTKKEQEATTMERKPPCFTADSIEHYSCDVENDWEPLPHIPCDRCGLLVDNTPAGRQRHIASNCKAAS